MLVFILVYDEDDLKSDKIITFKPEMAHQIFGERYVQSIHNLVQMHNVYLIVANQFLATVTCQLPSIFYTTHANASQTYKALERFGVVQ